MAGAQAGATVVFLPGFMQPAEAWSPVARSLPERYPSVLLEHEEHTFQGRLREISAAGQGSVLCGYSLGGRVALHAALRNPARYAGLITVSTSAGLDPAARAARAASDAKLAAWMETQPIERIVELWERQPMFADQAETLIEAQRPGRLAQDPRALALLLRTAGQGTLEPVWDRLPTLGLPVLAVAGALDEPYRKAARRIANSVPRGAFKSIEYAGHAPQLQRPESLASVLVEFLDEHFLDRGG